MEDDQVSRYLSELGRKGARARASAVKLVDDLTGESPVSADYPVGTVVIFGDGTGDQAVGSPDVNALDGRTQVWSAPTGGLAKQQVVAKANRSQASKTHTPPESECEVRRE
jgi:hypothetical protein